MQKTLITYLGGSAGGLLTASFNNIWLSFSPNSFSVIGDHCSIRQHEHKIITKELDLHSLLLSYKKQFISTHLYEELNDSINFKISLLCDNKEIQEKIILRQMYLQHLEIMINPEEKFFSIILSLCKKKLFKKAAKIWFEMAKNLWEEKMKTRFKNQLKNSKIIYVDKIFTPFFYDDVKEQQILLNLGTLKENHIQWLKKNTDFSYEKTIASMEIKLSKMDWEQESGIIKYNIIDTNFTKYTK